jgi:hypothetical protein
MSKAGSIFRYDEKAMLSQDSHFGLPGHLQYRPNRYPLILRVIFLPLRAVFTPARRGCHPDFPVPIALPLPGRHRQGTGPRRPLLVEPHHAPRQQLRGHCCSPSLDRQGVPMALRAAEGDEDARGVCSERAYA